jgi:hypothetical protein
VGAGLRVTGVDCGPLKLDKGIFVTGHDQNVFDKFPKNGEWAD